MLAVWLQLWPLGLALLIFCVAGVYCLVAQRRVLPWLGAIWALVVAAMAAGSVGATWNRSSAVGKFAALALTCGLPLGTAAVVFAAQRRSRRAPGMVAALAFGAGLPLVLAAPIVAVALACLFTGDCL